jgi:hypothetical protein
MAWMHCRSCSALFAVGLLRCPQCQAVSELFAAPEEVVEAEQEANVPKISVGGGPSSALGQDPEPETAVAEPDSSAAQAEPETSDAASAATATGEESEGGESPGGTDEPDSTPAPKPARKTAAKKAAAKQESASDK